MILVDSSVWIDYFNGKSTWQTEKLEQLLISEPVLMGDLIFTEVLQGFRNDKDFQKAKACLSILPFESMVGYDISLQSAINYRLLRKKGITVRKTIDIIIGTFCIMNHLRLLHDDRDFEPMNVHLFLKVF